MPSYSRVVYHQKGTRTDTWRSIFNAMWRIAVLAAWSLPGNGAVDSGAGDGEEFRQIADRVLAGLVHPPQLFVLFVRELGALAPQLSLGTGNGHPFAGAQTDEVGLKLGEGRQDVEEHLPHRIGGIIHAGAKRQLHPTGDQGV